MHAIVLGSAQDAGVPQIGCDCVHCQQGPERTAASLCVVHEGQALLLDTSPDIRKQWASMEGDLIGVLWTHAHMGHVAGAPQLGKEGPDLRVPGIGTPSLLAHVQAAAPHLGLAWQSLVPGGSLELGPFRIRALAINHRAESSDTVAILVEADGRRILYLPDTDAYDGAVEAAIAELRPGDALFFDATFWSPDEVAHRDVAQIPHPFVQGTLPRLAQVASDGVQVYLTHLNHTNPLCDPRSMASEQVRRHGIEVAEDGLRWP